MTGTSESASMFSLFRNRFILTIMSSALLLQIGIWVRNYAVLLFVMDETHGSAFAVSMISVADFAPILVFSFIGGAFADRWRPKRTMVWCDFLSAMSIGVVLLALNIGGWHVVFFATLVSSMLSQFSQPSGMRLFKLHVPESLMQAGMSLYQTLFAVFMIVGPILGTLVYQHLGIKVAIAIMGVAFLLSAGVLTFLPKDPLQTSTRPSASIRREMIEGLQYVIHRRFLRDLGGGFLAMMVSKKVRPEWMLVSGLIANTIGIPLIGWSMHLWITLLLQFVSGLFIPALQIGIQTLILQHTDEPYIGRVNGTLNPLFMGGMIVTMTVSGGMKAATSLTAVYFISGALFAIGCAILLPHVRKPKESIVSPTAA